jgi:hypothetical protein
MYRLPKPAYAFGPDLRERSIGSATSVRTRDAPQPLRTNLKSELPMSGNNGQVDFAVQHAETVCHNN